MSSLSQFTNKPNLKLLWDVLLDELNINKTNTKLIGNIRTVFESNINPFSSRANPKLQIMELNKQFLSQVVLAVNRLFPTLKQEQNINFDFNEVFETSEETLRKSVDGELTFVKYEGIETPSSVELLEKLINLLQHNQTLFEDAIH
jgi:hypothetical protein